MTRFAGRRCHLSTADVAPKAWPSSSLALPAAVRRLLPIGHGMARVLHCLPMRTGRLDLGGVMAVEQEHGTLVTGKVGRHRAVDQEPYPGLVWIAVAGGQQ